MKTALYRHFGSDGSLLYVGISLSAHGRLAQHMKRAKWATEITRIEIEWLDSRAAATAAERSAIIGEKPRYNTIHAASPPDACVSDVPGVLSLRKISEAMVQHVMSGDPPPKTRFYYDEDLRGFGLYRTSGGVGTFFAEFRLQAGGSKRRQKIGRALTVRAHDARREAARLLAAATTHKIHADAIAR